MSDSLAFNVTVPFKMHLNVQLRKETSFLPGHEIYRCLKSFGA